jgi:hypothetical protein
MSREGEGRFAHGELVGALFGRLRLAVRNIARGLAPGDSIEIDESGTIANRESREVSDNA